MAETSQALPNSPFEPGCPYHGDGPGDYLHHGHGLMFRFTEQFGGLQYIGDSFGDRTFIDVPQSSSCSDSCFCRNLEHRLRDEFVFIVRKDATSMKIDVNSVVLSSFLAGFIGQDPDSIGSSVFNGLTILRNAEVLQRKIRFLDNKIRDGMDQGSPICLPSENDRQLRAELSLLLDGLIMDYQAFQSFGYENLYEHGYLTFDIWKTFQSARTLNVIDQLENTLSPVNDHSVMTSSPDPSLAIQNDDTPPIKDRLPSAWDFDTHDISGQSDLLLEVDMIIQDRREASHRLQRLGINFDDLKQIWNQYPLIKALDENDFKTISELLTHTSDFRFLLSLGDADRWRFATTLIVYHGVTTESILDVLPKSTATAKRLRCALFDAKLNAKASIALTRSSGDLRSLDPTSAFEGASEANKNMSLLERGLICAIERKDPVLLLWCINQFADPSLGLSAALSIQNAQILAMLFEKGADPECIIPSKAEAALMSAVKAGDSPFVDLLLETCNKKSDCLDNVDFINDEWTPMMIAVQQNHQSMVKILLRYKANPVFETHNGSALTIARQTGCEEILPLLLASVNVKTQPTYCRCLRCLNQDSAARGLSEDCHLGCSPLREPRPRLDPRFMPAKARKPSKLDILHYEFKKQHKHIMKAMSLGPDDRSFTFADNDFWPLSMGYCGLLCCLDQTCSEAWRSGIKVMRELCIGKLPSSINGVLMFIAIAKAITSSGVISPSHIQKFDIDGDFVRWQIPFEQNSSLLRDYQKAVNRIWGIDIERLSRIDRPDLEILEAFQELATSLANVADTSFDLRGYGNGLLVSQERWYNRVVTRDCEDPVDTVWQNSQPCLTEAQALHGPKERTTKLPEQTQNPPKTRKKASIWNEVQQRHSLPAFSPTAIILMAGVMFSVILTFMLVLQSSFRAPSFSAISLKALYVRSLEDSVEHLTHILRTKLACDYEVAIKAVRKELLSCIQLGIVADFSSLVNFVHNKMTNESSKPGQFVIIEHLLKACKLWESSYVLQERFQILQVYLGLGGYKRIVKPSRTDPSGWANASEAILSNRETQVEFSSSNDSTINLPEPRSTSPYTESATIPIETDSPSSPSLEPQPATSPAPPTSKPDLSGRVIRCAECHREFKGAKAIGNRNKHRRDKHDINNQRFPCRYPNCRAILSRKAYRGAHEEKQHGVSYE